MSRLSSNKTSIIHVLHVCNSCVNHVCSLVHYGYHMYTTLKFHINFHNNNSVFVTNTYTINVSGMQF